MLEDNKIVHGLWIGKELSNLELLTINSFLQNGHDFHLWLYDSVSTSLPDGTVVEDANEILPRSSIFRYKSEFPLPREHRVRSFPNYGKESLAGFSDLFRYRLLYEKGGWWSDLDNTCLRTLDLEAPYVFKARVRLGATGNIMKCPPRSQLMRRCFECAKREVTQDNTDWTKPIQILAESIQEFGLGRFIRKGISNYDLWQEIEPYLNSNKPIPEDYYVLHWGHEAWRSLELDKNDIRPDTTFGALLRRFKVVEKQ